VRPARPDDPPIVSIVTPCLAPVDALLGVAASLRGQTLQSFEWCLVVDRDGSPERLAPLHALAAEDPRIRLLSMPGPLDAGSGLDAVRTCRAPYVALLGPSEEIEPTALESLCACLASYDGLGFVSGRTAVHGERYLTLDGEGAASEAPDEPCPARVVVRRDLLVDLLDHAPDAARPHDRTELVRHLVASGARGATIPEVYHWIPWRDPGRPCDRTSLASQPPAESAASARPGPDAALLANPLAARRKRLVCIAPSLSAEASGQIIAQALPLLGRQGWQITVVALEDGDPAAEQTLGRLTPDLHVLERFARPADWPRHLLGLLESRRPAVVLFDAAHLPSALTRYARMRHPASHYIALHHDDPDEPAMHGPCRPVDADDGADVVLSSSMNPEPAVSETAGTKSARHSLPVCADTLVWRPRPGPRTWMRPQWGVADDVPVLLFAGALRDRQRLEVFVAALAGLHDSGERCFAVIAGDGEARSWLEQELRRRGLDERVRVLGATPPGALLRTLAAVDLFVSPSRSGFASVLVQAMAMELPVVASDVGAHRVLVTPACGRLVAAGPDECAGFVEALRTLVRDPELRRQLGKQARQRVLLHFAPDRLLQQLESAIALSVDRAHETMSPPPQAAFAAAVEATETFHDARLVRRRAERLQREVATLESQRTALEQEREAARHELRALESRRAEETRRFDERGRELEAMREAVTNRNAELAAVRDAAAGHDAAHRESTARLEELERKVEDLQRERLALASELRSLGTHWWRPRALARQTGEIGRRLHAIDGGETPS
jgi:glycosyltransferase involved in cell wall biosynthesis